MLNNLGEIYNYTKDVLLQGEIDDIAEIIEYLEEGQQRISERVPIEAPIYTVTLTTNEITLPADFKKFKKLKVDDVVIEPDEVWAGLMTLPATYTTGTAKLYYYKKPTALVSTNLAQVPDIDQRYYSTIAQYAAEMYYMVDDDTEMQQKFTSKFFESIEIYGNSKNTVSKYKNIW